jgi:MFS transporter, FSR family, fosmidomycin resistance protein
MTAIPATANVFRRDAQVIGLVGLAHATSHFFHLILAPLFPWLKSAFNLSYAQLGLLMTVFFVVSGVGQALAGFVVDRHGALKVLLGGIALLAIAALGLALSPSYAALMFFSGVAGLGNSIFHPSDFTILNKRVSHPRLAHAFSFHGIAGAIGWAVAPPFLAGVAAIANWRVALCGAAILALTVLIALIVNRNSLGTKELADALAPSHKQSAAGSLAFMALPGVWMCFAFFTTTAFALGGIQSFTPAALMESYSVPLTLATLCVTAYMLSSAMGTLAGGFVATRVAQHEKIIAMAFISAAALALLVATGNVPQASLVPLFALIGFGSGIAGPSRDLLVRAASPRNATGRVYGVVYSGLDVGVALAPLAYGAMMDKHHPLWIFAIIGTFQALAIFTALGVGASAAAQRRQPTSAVRT